MAKADYAPRRRTTRKKTSPLPGWAWMLIGLMVGLFVAFLVFLHKTPPSGEGARPEPETPPPAAPETKKKEGLQFDFYKLLPEMEVAIPPEEVVPPAHDREPVNYYLQAGSFRDSADADGRKAELALLGLEATIQTVTINGTATWHRIRLGPFQETMALDRARRRLQENGYEFMLTREKIEIQ